VVVYSAVVGVSMCNRMCLLCGSKKNCRQRFSPTKSDALCWLILMHTAIVQTF